MANKNTPEAAVEESTVADKETEMLAGMTNDEKLGFLLAQYMALKEKDEKRDAEAGKSPEQLAREQKKAELKAKIEAREAYLNETVTINLPLIPISGYKEDVFVSINNEPPILIKRGEDVEIKRKYAILLKESQMQNKVAIKIMENKSDLYAKDERTLAQ